MSDKFFVDTNILLYAYDRTAGQKHQRSRALLEQLWQTGEGTLSTQVLQEFCVNIRHKVHTPVPVAEVREILDEYQAWDIQFIWPTTIMKALDKESKFRIAFWDALILQSAEDAGASVLYTEDLNHGQLYGPVRVLNPLL
jgi:predicted nucleic acid-binding protein